MKEKRKWQSLLIDYKALPGGPGTMEEFFEVFNMGAVRCT